MLFNNSRNLQITTTLDEKGRSPNLIQEIGIKANLKSLPSESKLIFDDPKVPYAPQLNLATDKFISITIPEDQMINLSRKVEEIGQTIHKNQVSTITDIKYTNQDPRQKILLAQNQDAKLVYLRDTKINPDELN